MCKRAGVFRCAPRCEDRGSCTVGRLRVRATAVRSTCVMGIPWGLSEEGPQAGATDRCDINRTSRAARPAIRGCGQHKISRPPALRESLKWPSTDADELDSLLPETYPDNPYALVAHLLSLSSKQKPDRAGRACPGREDAILCSRSFAPKNQKKLHEVYS